VPSAGRHFYGPYIVDAAVVNSTGSRRRSGLCYEVADEDQIEPLARARVLSTARDADGLTMDQAGEDLPTSHQGR